MFPRLAATRNITFIPLSKKHWLSSSDDEERAVDEEMLDGVDCFGEVLDIKGGGLHYDNEEAVGSEHERAVREFEDI